MTLLTLLMPLLVSQTPTPIVLQALVPTSGSNGAALLDGDDKTGWSPSGDTRFEGLLFRFETDTKVRGVKVRSCPGAPPFTVRPFFNGAAYGDQRLMPGTEMVVAEGLRSIRSMFLFIPSASSGVCIAEVDFGASGPVRPPRTLKATVKTSSVLEPAAAYHPGYLFDARLDFGWVEGVKGPGLKESVTLTFDAATTVTALELWNGYQRSQDHFVKNARAKKVSLTIDGGPAQSFAVTDTMGAQKLQLAKPVTATSLTLTIDDAYKGTAYDDLVLSELRLWDEQGPRSIVTTDLQDLAKALAQEIAGKPLEQVVGRAYASVCTKHVSAKFRLDHTFVAYQLGESAEGELSEVLDGTWVVKAQSDKETTVELFGRSHRTETTDDAYAGASSRQIIGIVGGPLKLTRVADLGKEGFAALTAKWKKSPAKAEVSCSPKYDDLVRGEALVIEGRAVTALVAQPDKLP